MQLLVLGGTKFVGRAIVEAALREGHAVTLFNRGLTQPTGQALFGGSVAHIVGDRSTAGGLEALHQAGQTWDVAIDCAGYFPSEVRTSTTVLKSLCRRYVFISSISAYGDDSSEREAAYAAAGGPPPSLDAVLAAGGVDEDTTPRSIYSNGDPEQASTIDQYGPLKAACEVICEEEYPGACMILRPGYIVGPWDPTGRWVTWAARVARGGEVLAFGPPSTRLQWIDVRDLADFAVHLCAITATAARSDVFNVVGTGDCLDARPSISELLEASAAVTGSGARVTYADNDFFLGEAAVAEAAGGPGPSYTSLPFWDPSGGGSGDERHEDCLMMAVSNRKAVRAGLRFRPIEETVRAALESASPPADGSSGGHWGMEPTVEAALLKKWHARCSKAKARL